MEGLEHNVEIATGKVRNLDTRCLSVVSCELGPVTPRIWAPGGRLCSSASLSDVVHKENFLHLLGIEPQFFGRPASNLVSILTYSSFYYLFSVYLMTSSIARILRRQEEIV
jgi:hypothetical protein